MTVVSWATASDIGIWVGIFIGIAGLVVNLYFRRRQDRRAQESHIAFMRKLELGGTPNVQAPVEADE